MHWKKRHKFRKLLHSKLRKKRWWMWIPEDFKSYADYKRYVRSYCRRNVSRPPMDPEVRKAIIQAEWNGMPIRKWNEQFEDRIIQGIVDAEIDRNVLGRNKKHIKK